MTIQVSTAGSQEGNVLFLLKADVEKVGGGVENALLYFHEGEIGADGLRIEIVLGAAH